MSAPEFSRTVRVDTLGDVPRKLALEANEAERKALARRFGLAAIDALTAEAVLSGQGTEVIATGTLSAKVTQRCVATDEPIPVKVDTPFEIHFRPQPEVGSPEEEIELSANELDVVFYDSAAIDVGDAVAETLSLSLDPYPRIPGADDILKAAGVKSEGEAGPFGALAGLRDKLKK